MARSNNKNVERQQFYGLSLGICFGAGIGIIIGLFINNVPLSLTAGSVIGLSIGNIYDIIWKKKRLDERGE